MRYTLPPSTKEPTSEFIFFHTAGSNLLYFADAVNYNVRSQRFVILIWLIICPHREKQYVGMSWRQTDPVENHVKCLEFEEAEKSGWIERTNRYYCSKWVHWETRAELRIKSWYLRTAKNRGRRECEVCDIHDDMPVLLLPKCILIWYSIAGLYGV